MTTTYGEQDVAEFTARLAAVRAELEAPTDAGAYVAYTDGACFGNPAGNGGWGAAVFPADDPVRQWLLFGHLSSTSNNRAEALAVLAALEWVPSGSKLELRSDSELTVRQLQGRYKIKANLEIWQLIQALRVEKRLELVPEWVRGHVGDPLNELADRLSKLGARRGDIADLGAVRDARPTEPRELEGVAPKTDWEREFVSSVRDQLRRGRGLSDKQRAVIERIRARPS